MCEVQALGQLCDRVQGFGPHQPLRAAAGDRAQQHRAETQREDKLQQRPVERIDDVK